MTALLYLTQRFPVITETFTIAEVQGLERAGLDVHLAALRPPPDDLPPSLVPLAERVRVVAPRDTARGLARLAARSPGQLVRAAPRPRRALAAVRGAWLAGDLGGEVGHVHVQFPLDASNAALFASLASGAGFSFSGHTYHELELMREKLARARFVTVGSDFERDLLCSRYGERWRDRIHVRRLGVPPRPQRQAVEPWTVCSIGTLTGKKGHDVLVRAVAELARRGRPVRLQIVGEGPQRPDLAALAASLGVADRVDLLGARAHEEALRRAAASAAFALCCVTTPEGDHDGLPVALMDAMSVGVPAVSSRAFGIPELIDDGRTGRLTRPGDVVGVADALDELLGDQDAAEAIGAAGRAAVRERYDLDTNVAALAELFGRFLA